MAIHKKYIQNQWLMAIGLMLVSAVCVALLNFSYKQAMLYVALSYAAFFRQALPLIVLAPFLYKQKLSLWQHWPLQALRGLIVCVYMYSLFICVKHTSVLVATLLFSTGPLFLPFLSRIFLKKTIRARVLIAAIIGFIGVAVALKPEGCAFNLYAVFGLISGLGNAASQVCLHKGSRKTSSLHNMACMYFWSALFLLIPMIYFMIVQYTTLTPSFNVIWIFIAMVFLSLLNQQLRGLIYLRVNNPASILPLLYLSIPLAGLLDWWTYAKLPTWNEVVGALIIIASVCLISTLKVKTKSV